MEKVPYCPFCGSTKLIADGRGGSLTHDGGGNTGRPYRLVTRYVCSMRCNSCHARGPTSSFFVEEGKIATEAEIAECAYNRWPDNYFKKVQ